MIHKGRQGEIHLQVHCWLGLVWVGLFWFGVRFCLKFRASSVHGRERMEVESYIINSCFWAPYIGGYISGIYCQLGEETYHRSHQKNPETAIDIREVFVCYYKI